MQILWAVGAKRREIDGDNDVILSVTGWRGKLGQISLSKEADDKQYTFECASGYLPELIGPDYTKPIPLHAYNPQSDTIYICL